MKINNIEIDVDIEPTPNPNALKFITNIPVKASGSSTYRTPNECAHNPLALELFKIRGVDTFYKLYCNFFHIHLQKIQKDITGIIREMQ
jgi:hypothetical protein